MLLTVVAVFWVQLTETEAGRTAGRAPDVVHELTFQKLDARTVHVLNTEGDQVTALIEGRDGLLLRALQGLERSRTLRDLPLDAPYQLVVWDNGRRTLSDLAMDRHIPIDSFGPANGALLVMMQMGADGGV